MLTECSHSVVSLFSYWQVTRPSGNVLLCDPWSGCGDQVLVVDNTLTWRGVCACHMRAWMLCDAEDTQMCAVLCCVLTMTLASVQCEVLRLHLCSVLQSSLGRRVIIVTSRVSPVRRQTPVGDTFMNHWLRPGSEWLQTWWHCAM